MATGGEAAARRAPRRAAGGRLVVVLGDQLDRNASVFDDFEPTRDAVWMAEVDEESSRVAVGKPRIALFLAAMRHFRDELRQRGLRVHYRELGDEGPASLAEALSRDLAQLRPQQVRLVRPGEWRVREALNATCAAAGVPLEEGEDRHFFCSPADFAAWASGRKEWRLEHFYRAQRRRTGVLMDGDQPCGGAWNYDADNRSAFPSAGPGLLPQPVAMRPDAVTQEVLALVERRFRGRAGDLSRFDWPVTPRQAEAALEDFVTHRLALFGRYQDALWHGEPWLYHSRLSAALNLKLLAPAVVVAAAERAYRDGRVPLEAAEGFIRQILGWREFVRGVYWQTMPDYAGRNALGATEPLPSFYWDAATDCACLADAIGQTLALGYAHHIQRLMITGLYALLLGVRPTDIHEWFLAVHVDAVEWVELPNVLGMSQYADGGVLASKPYIASGRYLDRMSNYCDRCRFRPDVAAGAAACPFTTLYWDFLDRHAARFARHPRLAQQVRNLERMAPATREAIRAQAQALRARGGRP